MMSEHFSVERRLTFAYRAAWVYLDQHAYYGDARVIDTPVIDRHDDGAFSKRMTIGFTAAEEVTSGMVCEALIDSLSGTNCTHEHDCCGCWHYSAEAEHVEGSVYAVVQHAARNY